MKKPAKLSLKERNSFIKRQIAGKNRKKPTLKERRYKNKTKRNPYHPKNKTRVEKISLPARFDLYQNTNETLKIMNEFRDVVDKKNPKLGHLAFDEITHINPSSALMLAAEIDVWNSKVPHKLSARHKTWNDEIKVLLCEMGFFELLGMSPLDDRESINKNTTFLKFISGQKAEGDKAKKLREKIEQTIGKELEEKIHLFEGLSEAFTNTRQHAYQKDSSEQYNKWWITASYKKVDKKLVVSMYDRGKGIPVTMKTGTKWGFLDEREYRKDSELIKIAMEQSFKNEKTRSATGEMHRGKGLKQLLTFIESKGKLTIISQKGLCAFAVKDDKLEITQEKALKYPLQGTLIEWEMVV